ncbi:MAG: hypothetical protein DMF56_00205 [Acidobacteria bacterium]|nr:MAG: hypothetical protein DMF56_00205 [Acidobacteriota bacterium]
MVIVSRIIAALAYAGAAFLFGLALGERGEFGPVQYVFWFVIPIATFVLALCAKKARAEIFLTGLVLFAGLRWGESAFAKAWDECVLRGRVVRAQIVERHKTTDEYPARLEDLGVDLPCKCVLRKTILHYYANERGFRLWMSNDRERIAF